MTISETKDGHAYFNNIEDVAKVGEQNRPKGFNRHNAFVGIILSVFGLAFKDAEAGWVNKKSFVHYANRNNKLMDTNLTESSSCQDVMNLFLQLKSIPKSIPQPQILNPGDNRVPISLESVARGVYENRIRMYQDAYDGNTPVAQTLFINKIKIEFEKSGFSLSDIANDKKALNLFMSNSLLRPALVQYAKDNQLQGILDTHLNFLATDIYDNRQAFASRLNPQDPPENQLFDLLTEVRSVCKRERRSLNEIINNKAARNILLKSSTLNLVLKMYVILQNPQANSPPQEIDQEQVKQQVAASEGREHGRGIGYVTQLGMNDMLGDEEQLRHAAKKFLLKNHPDKNPDSDPELVKAANNLLNLIKDGKFEIYRKALEEERNRG